MSRHNGTRTFLSNSTTGSPSLEYLPLKETGFLLLLAIRIVYCVEDVSPNKGEQIISLYFHCCKSMYLQG